MEPVREFEQYVVEPIRDLDDLRPLMPVTDGGLYLDHAAAGVLPTPTVEAMTNRIQSAATHGVRHWNLWQKVVQRTRRLVGELMTAHEDEIAFVPNTATGVGTVAEGICWQPGDNVVLPSSEFPSNRLPWVNLERRGVEVRQVETLQNGNGVTAALEQACDTNTKIVACSWVDYATGERRDPGKLAEMTHRRGALLVLDAIQALGVLPLDVTAQNVDVVVADSRKWLLGPEGAGVLMIRRDVQNRIDVSRPGWASMESPLDFAASDLKFSNSAARYESGMHNTFGLTGLHASVRLLKQIPLQIREERLLSIRDVFEEAGRSAGLACQALAPHARSGILTFTHPQFETKEVLRHLHRSGIAASLKNGRVRISPHLYNDAADARVFADVVSQLRA